MGPTERDSARTKIVETIEYYNETVEKKVAHPKYPSLAIFG